MGKIDDNDVMFSQKAGGSNITFSATKIDTLGASEYTLVTVCLDISGSLADYERDLEKMLSLIVEACRNPRNPRCDNMMLRVLLFNNAVSELHGFRPVVDLNPDDYKGVCSCGGITAAYDAAYDAAKASADYGQQLVASKFSANGAIFIVTDGCDNASKNTPKMVRKAISDCTKGESLESVMAVLIGLGDGATEDVKNLSKALTAFKDEAGFDQYEFAGTTDAKTLAKVANFISRSASSQSQALGTGGPSKSLSI